MHYSLFSLFFRTFALQINIDMAKRILFINQETIPYVPETELAVMGKKVPQVIQERGNEIRTFMPKWGTINERRGQLHEVQRLSGMNLIINDTDHPLIIRVATIVQTRVQVYFIDNDDYFSKRQMLTEENIADLADLGERTIFFSRGVLETVNKLRWAPDIIHCQGWMTSIIPFYLKTAYSEEPSFANTKVVTSLYPKTFDATMGENFKQIMEFKDAKAELLGKYNDDFGFDELSKLAIDSDGIIEANQDVNADLLKYAETNGKPLLRYPGEEFGNAYEAFYDQLCE